MCVKFVYIYIHLYIFIHTHIHVFKLCGMYIALSLVFFIYVGRVEVESHAQVSVWFS